MISIRMLLFKKKKKNNRICNSWFYWCRASSYTTQIPQAIGLFKIYDQNNQHKSSSDLIIPSSTRKNDKNCTAILLLLVLIIIRDPCLWKQSIRRYLKFDFSYHANLFCFKTHNIEGTKILSLYSQDTLKRLDQHRHNISYQILASGKPKSPKVQQKILSHKKMVTRS